MLFLSFLLIPMALAMKRTVQTQNCILTIDDNTLKEIRVNGKSPDVLDLSNLNIKAIDKKAFHHLSNLKTLNLADNSLKYLPEFVFSSLTNLENLDLANNALDFGGFYNGLNSLKTLNISNNPLSSFEFGHFYGLNNSTNIITRELPFWWITTGIFENPLTVTNRPSIHKEEYGLNQFIYLTPDSEKIVNLKYISKTKDKNDKLFIKFCMKKGHLKSLKSWNELEIIEKDCDVIANSLESLNFSVLGIRTFENGWYYLQDYNVKSLNLEYNEIPRITKQLLNDLPPEMVNINLRGNRIKKLERGVMMNKNRIELLDLSDNRISEIEYGALENLDIVHLLLNDNQLKSTKFLDSLPLRINTVSLSNNRISEISYGNFSKYTNFYDLDLSSNRIKEAKSRKLCDFSSLTILKLSNNGMTNIEPGFFYDIDELVAVYLNDNDISKIEKDVFTDLLNIVIIHLGSNKLKEIPTVVYSELPDTLQSLYLNNNEIEYLKAGTFVNVPKSLLNLNENKILKIEKGSFNLPSLRQLHLQNNFLKEIDGDSFDGLENLETLSLSSNNIKIIKKGAVQNLNNLFNLNLANNPINLLENGALSGLLKTEDTIIELSNVPIEIIQSGLFDDL